MTTFTDRVGDLLEARTSRRGLLARSAAVGAVFAAGPLRFLLYPSEAAAIGPGNCGGHACADGWTEFCCSVFAVGNDCPANTYYGGYWKCTNYTGGGYCFSVNVRYYVDCNAPYGTYWDHCANEDCDCRVQAHNNFQYGNCNTDHAGYSSSYVVCRKVLCHNPASDTSHCNFSTPPRDETCGHHSCRTCNPAI
jgi:hypothetical protein